jgi:hypothetical protein
LARTFLKEQQMADEVVVNQPTGSETTGNMGNQQQQTPGWLAGLPADLRDNEAFKPYRTVGDFAKAHLETANKAKEYEGKLANSIPKLGENATPEERDKFYTSLGRPDKPEGYELDPEKKNAPEWNKYWEDTLFSEGIPKKTAQALQSKLNAQLTSMVEAHNAKILAENNKAAETLKTELGDKYDASVVLVSRLWKQWGKTEVEFDKAFAAESSANRTTMMRFLLNVAAKTGEDSSLRGTGQRAEASKAGYDLSKFNLPPARI